MSKLKLLFLSAKILTVVCLFCLCALQAKASDAQDFFVSPRGSDSAPGNQEAPFQTIHFAKSMAVKAIAESELHSVNIWLMDGVHILEKPLDFYPEDNRYGKSKLSIKAFPGARPVISGGRKLSGWAQNSKGHWVTDVPNDLEPGELYVDDRRAIRARHPNAGYLRIKKAGEDRRTNFYFGEDDFPIPQHLSGLEVVVFHDWSVSRMPVREIDPVSYKLTAIDSIGAKSLAFFNLDNWEADPRYYLENAPEFLDAEMEWFFDPGKGQLILILEKNQNPSEMNIVVPVLENLVTFHGSRENPVRHLSFQGVTFAHCGWNVPDLGYNGIQACHFDDRSPDGDGWSVIPAAIYGEWIQDVRFEGCTIRQMGGSGLWLGTGSSECRISDCHFEDISGNGIMIGEGQDRRVNGQPWYKTAPEEVASGNIIEYSTVRQCGARFFGAVGIWCGLTAETMIRGNHIYDLPYTGISIGWMWDPTPTPCRDNTLKNNHIHHILQVLSDGGGIYSLGLQPGSRLTGNLIHDVQINTGRAESNGMFLDEGTTDVLVAGNLIYNIARSPLRFHKAGQNTVRDNWLFSASDIPPVRYNSTPEENIVKTGNLIFEVDINSSQDYFEPFIEKWEDEEFR